MNFSRSYIIKLIIEIIVCGSIASAIGGVLSEIAKPYLLEKIKLNINQSGNSSNHIYGSVQTTVNTGREDLDTNNSNNSINNVNGSSHTKLNIIKQDLDIDQSKNLLNSVNASGCVAVNTTRQNEPTITTDNNYAFKTNSGEVVSINIDNKIRNDIRCGILNYLEYFKPTNKESSPKRTIIIRDVQQAIDYSSSKCRNNETLQIIYEVRSSEASTQHRNLMSRGEACLGQHPDSNSSTQAEIKGAVYDIKNQLISVH